MRIPKYHFSKKSNSFSNFNSGVETKVWHKLSFTYDRDKSSFTREVNTTKQKKYIKLKYTYSILPLSNCPLSPGNGHLNKLRLNKSHFYLRVQKEIAQCLSKYLYIVVEVYFKPEKSSYLSIPENNFIKIFEKFQEIGPISLFFRI